MYLKPEFDIFEVAEHGYGYSSALPGLGSTNDGLVY